MNRMIETRRVGYLIHPPPYVGYLPMGSASESKRNKKSNSVTQATSSLQDRGALFVHTPAGETQWRLVQCFFFLLSNHAFLLSYEH